MNSNQHDSYEHSYQFSEHAPLFTRAIDRYVNLQSLTRHQNRTTAIRFPKLSLYVMLQILSSLQQDCTLVVLTTQTLSDNSNTDMRVTQPWCQIYVLSIVLLKDIHSLALCWHLSVSVVFTSTTMTRLGTKIVNYLVKGTFGGVVGDKNTLQCILQVRYH